MIVTLTSDELSSVDLMAFRRIERARAKGIKDRIIDGDNALMHEQNGLGAEVAYAKQFRLFQDFSNQQSTDFEHCGFTIDVKTTTYRHGKLLVGKHKKADPADYYCLVIAERPIFRIIGWATAASVFKPENLKPMGHGECYWLTQDRLLTLEHYADPLMELIERTMPKSVFQTDGELFR